MSYRVKVVGRPDLDFRREGDAARAAQKIADLENHEVWYEASDGSAACEVIPQARRESSNEAVENDD